METMVLCSTAKGLSSPFSLQQKHVSDKHIHYCKISHHSYCLRQTKGFSYGLRHRVHLPLRSTTSDEAWTGTSQTTSYVKDEPETTSEETAYSSDESKPVIEPEATSETTPDSKDESEAEVTSQPEPETVAASETTSESSEEPEPEPEPKPETEPDTAVTVEASSTDDTQIKAEVPQDSSTSEDSFDFFKILEDAGIKFDSEDKSSLYVLGASGVTALWLTSTILRAVDSIPVLPKVLELVGIGYTVWFSYRNLIFEEKRKELFAKIEQIKQEVIGSEED